MGVSDCARYTSLVEQMKRSERIQNINTQFQVRFFFLSDRKKSRTLLLQDLFEFLEKNAGQPVPDLFAAWAISDTIIIEVNNI